jgi:hypothetical protein
LGQHSRRRRHARARLVELYPVVVQVPINVDLLAEATFTAVVVSMLQLELP